MFLIQKTKSDFSTPVIDINKYNLDPIIKEFYPHTGEKRIGDKDIEAFTYDYFWNLELQLKIKIIELYITIKIERNKKLDNLSMTETGFRMIKRAFN